MEPVIAPRQTGEAPRLSAADLFERMSRFEGPPEQFLSTLLTAQCEMAGAVGGAIFRRAEGGPEVLAVYPPLSQGQPVAPKWLSQAGEMIEEALKSDAAEIRPFHMPDDLYGMTTRRHVILIPIRREGAMSGVAVFLMEMRDTAQLAAIEEKLRLSVSVLGVYEMRILVQRRGTDLRRLRAAMETLAAGNEQVRFAGLAMAFCNEVATRWQCDRVCLGFLKGRSVVVRAMSHTEKFSRRMKSIQDIEAAMEECLDQDVEVMYPSSPEATFVSRAAAELSKRQGPSSILSLPMRTAGQASAVLLLERPADKPFVLEEIESLRLAADLVVPRLASLEENDRWVGARLAVGLRKAAAAAIGPKHTWIKLAVLAVFGLAVFMIFVKGTYRVEAPFTVEPIEEQAIPAPFDGFISRVFVEAKDIVEDQPVLAPLDGALKQVNARGGDVVDIPEEGSNGAFRSVKDVLAVLEPTGSPGQAVAIVSPIRGAALIYDMNKNLAGPIKKGDVLCRVKTVLAMLETSDLELQRADADKERDVYELQAKAASRDVKTVEALIAQAQAAKCAAQIALLDYEIARSAIVAPVGGDMVVVYGDLKHNIRGPLKLGDVMFKVAPLEMLRAVASVPDADIVDVKDTAVEKDRQKGECATPSKPNIHMAFEVERVNPVAEVVNEHNVFKVRLKIENRPDWLRPGMEGIAKIDIEQRPYGMIWLRPAINWVRMKLWM
jgi:ribosomal protein S28E/S33